MHKDISLTLDPTIRSLLLSSLWVTRTGGTSD